MGIAKPPIIMNAAIKAAKMARFLLLPRMLLHSLPELLSEVFLFRHNFAAF